MLSLHKEELEVLAVQRHDLVQRGNFTYNPATCDDYLRMVEVGPKGHIRALGHVGPGERRRSPAPAGLKMRFSGSGHHWCSRSGRLSWLQVSPGRGSPLTGSYNSTV